MTEHKKKSLLGRLSRLVGLGLVVAAVGRELAKPPGTRTWHGTVAKVPYDFRLPTAERMRARLWAPEDPRLLTPQIFGVGWSVNLGRLVALLRGRASEAQA